MFFNAFRHTARARGLGSSNPRDTGNPVGPGALVFVVNGPLPCNMRPFSGLDPDREPLPIFLYWTIVTFGIKPRSGHAERTNSPSDRT
jgi:hypothetical protein